MKTKLWAKLAALFASLCAGAGLAACENSAGGTSAPEFELFIEKERFGMRILL